MNIEQFAIAPNSFLAKRNRKSIGASKQNANEQEDGKKHDQRNGTENNIKRAFGELIISAMVARSLAAISFELEGDGFGDVGRTGGFIADHLLFTLSKFTTQHHLIWVHQQEPCLT